MVTVHTCVLTGHEEQRGDLLVSVVLVYLLVFTSRTQEPWVSYDLGLCSSAAIVILNSKSLKQALLPTCKEWSGSFCFSP